MKKKLLILLIASISLNSIHGQSEYRKGILVTNKGDTISGLIGYREGARSYKVCSFKKSKGASVTKYAPNQIQSYGFINDTYYVSKQVENDKGDKEDVFFEVLVKGKLTLYHHSRGFFVEKFGEGLHELTNYKIKVVKDGKTFIKASKRYMGVLLYLTNDCEDFTKIIEQAYIDEKNLTKLVEKYNRCIGEESLSYKENKPWFKANFGLVFGLNSSQIIFSFDNPESILGGSDFNRAYSIMPGISIDLLSPRVNEKFSLHTGLFYLSTEYLSYSENVIRNRIIYRTDIRMDIQQIKIPFGFRYTFSNKEIVPYVNAGASYTIQLKASSKFVLEKEFNNVVETIEGEVDGMDPTQFGYWGGIGVIKSISEKLSGFVELRYEKTSGIAGNEYVNNPFNEHSVQNLQLLIGISF